jgi:hypothetical protein
MESTKSRIKRLAKEHSSFAALPPLGNGWIGDWTPGMGDPSLGGWLTVLLYFLAAWRCWLACRNCATPQRRERRLWLFLALLLVALGINKQLDLQSAVTEFGRVLAYEQGWYETRAKVQAAMVIGIGLLALVTSGALLSIQRGASRPAKLAVVGFGLLALFVSVRAVSIHHFDRFIASQWLGLRANWLLEIGGILVILCAASFRGSRFSPLAGRGVPRAARKVRVVVVGERSNR